MPWLIALALAPILGNAASVTMSWAPNPERNIAGYVVYFGEKPGTYTTITNVGNATSTVFNGLTEGTTYYFNATAYNTYGLESALATEVAFTIPTASTQNRWANSMTRAANGMITLWVTGIPGQTNYTLASTDLLNWRYIRTNVLTTSPMKISVSNPGGTNRIFYRTMTK